MGPRRSWLPKRSSRSPTAAWMTCGRRTVEVSQACRHVAGAAAAEPACTLEADDEVRCFCDLRYGMAMRCLHAITKVAPCHSFHGARKGTRRGEAFKKPSGEF